MAVSLTHEVVRPAKPTPGSYRETQDRRGVARVADRLRVHHGDRASSGQPRPVRGLATMGIISDGAGGCAGGALAAELTVREVVARFDASEGVIDETVVSQAVMRANTAVRSRRASDAAVADMAATLTLAVATAVHSDESSWLVVNVGDSPAWLAASDGFTRVTEEHNVAAELARSGVISRDAARMHPGRHVVTRAIGGSDTVMVDPVHIALHRRDQLVVASDGLEVLNEPEVQEVIRGARTARDAARRLVDGALSGNASDNVTVAVLRHL